MIFIDFVFWGWYQILDKTIYSFKAEKDGLGPKEHSFFITFLLHGINIWTVLSFLSIAYLGKTVDLYIGLLIAVGVFTIGYFMFYKSKRVNIIISLDMSFLKALISIIITVSYSVLTIYLMLEAGSFIRYK